MQRSLLLAAVLSTTVSVAQADHDRVKWDGAMRVVGESPQCGGQFSSPGNERARFHPQFETETPESSFTRFRGNEVELIRKDGDGQFNGSGSYYLYRISGGDVAEIGGEYSSQTYSFTQTPATVLETTQFVTLVGSLYNYDDIGDCTLTLRGTFVRVDAEAGP